ncbi:MAG: Na+/H+ antiporter NhaC family protein [Eubacteriales bacterium]|nr:Na+/H+ antiporter NhaC family protein [Eubacteriales bacterium]
MKKTSRTRKILALVILAGIAVMVLSACAPAKAGKDYHSSMVGTAWALLPPLVAICLALITKEVHSSLFAGIFLAAVFYTKGNFHGTLDTILNDGFISALSDSGHVGILLFLVILGIIVALVNKSGGSKAYGEWAKKHIKTRMGAILATFALGCLIFIDDYFNCLTVGSVMRPVTDSHRVSRAKLAYIIDATAAPICMIAPISSWAAAVSGYVKGYNGLALFVRSIPYNFYSLMTIVMILILTIGKFDFGPMREHELNAIEKNDLFTTKERPYEGADEKIENAEGGKVMDLLFPIIVLIISCVICMIYTGGFFDGESFINAFANSTASYGLSLGAGIALIITIVYILLRKRMSFTDAMACIPEGFQAMVPPILILTFAWTLSNLTGLMGAGSFVAGVMENTAGGFQMFLPAIIFAVSCFLGFSTGTSWGTFGILIPIVVALFPNSGSGNLPEMLVISISACCAGGVCGDHCSPISDTTIMASTGAECDHINHVSTQLPYAFTCVAFSFVGYIIAGIFKSAWIALPLTTVITIIGLLIIRKRVAKDGHAVS